MGRPVADPPPQGLKVVLDVHGKPRHSVRGIVVHRQHLYVADEAGDAVKILTALIDTNASTGKGAIAAQISGAKEKITTYNEDMQKLETRMSMLLERYAKQFAAMDTLLASIKSQQTGLKSTFDGMAAMYSNN